MPKIYIVYRSQGMYDDHIIEDLKAFLDKRKALRFKNVAKKKALELMTYYHELRKRPDLQYPSPSSFLDLRRTQTDEERERFQSEYSRINQKFEELRRISKYDPNLNFQHIDFNSPMKPEYDIFELELVE